MKTAVSSPILPHLFEHMVVDVVLVNEIGVPEIVCSGTLIFYESLMEVVFTFVLILSVKLVRK